MRNVAGTRPLNSSDARAHERGQPEQPRGLLGPPGGGRQQAVANQPRFTLTGLAPGCGLSRSGYVRRVASGAARTMTVAAASTAAPVNSMTREVSAYGTARLSR